MKFFLKIFNLFSKWEKILFISSLILAVISGVIFSIYIINKITINKPAYGGKYTEGIVGQPSFINPVLAKPDSPDMDLSVLLFASLNDIAGYIKPNKDYTEWTVRIKDNASWSDGTKITSDDIIFTIRTIQNTEILSPLYQDFEHIDTSRVSIKEIKFKLASPYSSFKENILEKLRPIPKKLFADLSPSSLRLSAYNIEPLGSGPYKYSSLIKNSDGFIEKYMLKKNELYKNIGKSPYIDQITIGFYKNTSDMLKDYNIGAIEGFYTTDSGILNKILPKSKIIDIPTTKYTAIFLNKNFDDILKSDNIRSALALSINRDSIVEKVYKGRAIKTLGPIPPTFKSYNSKLNNIIKYAPDKARELIKEDDWKYNEETKSWTKQTENNLLKLKITLTTPNIQKMKATAEIIKSEWENIGIKTKINLVDPEIINDKIIKTRNYSALLFGNSLSNNPDMYSFWSSSERFYPGLNLSVYKDNTVDNFILKLRSLNLGSSKRNDVIKQLQEKIVSDTPAIFLVSPYSFYIVRSNIPEIIIKRISYSSDRFNKILDWYVKTKRSIKKSK